MTFILTAEQREVRDVADRYFSERAPVAILRSLRDSAREPRYSEEIWQQLRELGFIAAAVPEAYGGIGTGFAALGRILIAAGRSLAPTPLFATGILGAGAIELCGSEAQRAEWLPAIAEGRITFALAHEEKGYHAPDRIEATARPTTGGYVLEGRKAFVIDGDFADAVLMLAMLDLGSSRKPALFFVERGAPGLTTIPVQLTDSRSHAHLAFDELTVPLSALLGDGENMADRLDALMDRARICTAAEMLGMAQELFDRTLDYLRQREQFGVKIGSFQALKHRAARLFVELELTKSVVMAALAALDAGAPDLPALAALAKTRANDSLETISNEAIQMHGGVGVTDELDLGLFLKRARVLMQSFGSSRWLRARYATIEGF